MYYYFKGTSNIRMGINAKVKSLGPMKSIFSTEKICTIATLPFWFTTITIQLSMKYPKTHCATSSFDFHLQVDAIYDLKEKLLLLVRTVTLIVYEYLNLIKELEVQFVQ